LGQCHGSIVVPNAEQANEVNTIVIAPDLGQCIFERKFPSLIKLVLFAVHALNMLIEYTSSTLHTAVNLTRPV